MGRTPTRLALRGMIAEISASVLNLLGFARQLSSQPSYQRRWRNFAESCYRRLVREFLMLLKLLKVALLWFLFRSPAQESGAVTKAPAGEMIVLDFDHQFCFQRLPVA